MYHDNVVVTGHVGQRSNSTCNTVLASCAAKCESGTAAGQYGRLHQRIALGLPANDRNRVDRMRERCKRPCQYRLSTQPCEQLIVVTTEADAASGRRDKGVGLDRTFRHRHWHWCLCRRCNALRVA